MSRHNEVIFTSHTKVGWEARVLAPGEQVEVGFIGKGDTEADALRAVVRHQHDQLTAVKLAAA